jgi:hypothetical protein
VSRCWQAWKISPGTSGFARQGSRQPPAASLDEQISSDCRVADASDRLDRSFGSSSEEDGTPHWFVPLTVLIAHRTCDSWRLRNWMVS